MFGALTLQKLTLSKVNGLGVSKILRFKIFQQLPLSKVKAFSLMLTF
jgi:hypothetical protein